jgi:hypothetical protein
MAQRQSYPSTKEEFIRWFPSNERNTIHSLPSVLATASGSRWNKAHLEASRVILSRPEQPTEHLEVLRPYYEKRWIPFFWCLDFIFIAPETQNEGQ